MELVNSIVKDVCGAELLPVTISAYPVDCVCFWHLWKTQYYCLCLNRRYNLSPAVNPPSPPTSALLPPTHLLMHATCNITVAMKLFGQNPAVLASYSGNYYKTLAKSSMTTI